MNTTDAVKLKNINMLNDAIFKSLFRSSEARKLIKLLRQTTIEEMEKEFEADEIYMACVRRVEELSTDPEFIGYYDIEEARRQENEDFEMTGFRKGREAGEKNKQIEIAKKMLKDNIDMEIIFKYTSLSIEEVNNLLNN